MNKSFVKVVLLSTTTLFFAPGMAEAMPPAVVAIGAAAATTFIGGTTILGLNLFGSFLVRAALGLALNALAPKPEVPDNSRGGYVVTQRGTALDQQVVYGRARVGGVVVYDGTTGSENKYLHRVIAFAGHEIESFDEIYINDKIATIDGDGKATTRDFGSGIRINTHLGDENQLADADLVSEVRKWTNDHRLRGVSYIYARFTFKEDRFPNGVPEVTAVIKGKKLYDPRTDTTAWSDNPALCLRDYITSGYGLGESPNNVDDTLFSAAANVCDETGTLGGETRYTCNGAFTTGITPYNALNDILSSMGGLLWYAQGKWRVKPAYWTTPVADFTEDDLVGSLQVQTRHSRRDNFNAIQGKFRGEESNWQFTDYPKIENSSFLEADNNQESVLDFDLPFTDTSVEARRIARISLERNRQQLTVQGTFGLKAFGVQVGDNVRLTNSRMGWSNKEFEVVSWTFGLQQDQTLQVQMELRETSENIFDEVDDGAVFETDNTTLLSPFEVPDVGLSLSTNLRLVNEEVFGVINVTVNSNNALTDFFEVQYKKNTDTEFISLGYSTAKTFEILIPEDGTYDIRARATNTFGVRGNWSTTEDFEAKPFAAPPATVDNLSITPIGGNAILSWDAVADLDLSHYKIRFSPLTTGAKYTEAIDLVPKVARPATSVTVPLAVGTYFVKTVDKQGNESTLSSNVTTNISAVGDYNVVVTRSEEDTATPFNGTLDNVDKIEDPPGTFYLTLGGGTLFDDATGLFDAAAGDFDFGFGVVTLGNYEYDGVTDLGAVYPCRVVSDLVFRLNDVTGILFDEEGGLFDSKAGLMDGDVAELSVLSVRNQVSYTQDDPAGTPTWSAWEDFLMKDITARAFRFRVLMSTQDENKLPQVTTLGATIDVPDRVESGENISFSGGTTSVTFDNAFYSASTPAIGVSIAGLSSGDYYTITNKDNTGFDLAVYDSTDTLIAGTLELDYVAKGYGKEI